MDMMTEAKPITIGDFIQVMFATAWDRVCAAIATGAVLLPVWHPTLKDVSEASSLIAPILGCAWLAIQIISKIWQIMRAKPSADDEGDETG